MALSQPLIHVVQAASEGLQSQPVIHIATVSPAGEQSQPVMHTTAMTGSLNMVYLHLRENDTLRPIRPGTDVAVLDAIGGTLTSRSLHTDNTIQTLVIGGGTALTAISLGSSVSVIDIPAGATLDLTGVTVTGYSPPAATLASTLAAGNTTGANDIEITNGDELRFLSSGGVIGSHTVTDSGNTFLLKGGDSISTTAGSVLISGGLNVAGFGSGSATLRGGVANNTGQAGSAVVQGGDCGTNGTGGGSVLIRGGNGSPITAGNGGGLTLSGGQAMAGSSAGAAVLNGGDSNGSFLGIPGGLTIRGGNSSNALGGAAVDIRGGASTSGSGGVVNITGGLGGAIGGDVIILSGGGGAVVSIEGGAVNSTVKIGTGEFSDTEEVAICAAGNKLSFHGAAGVAQQTVTGSTGANAALQDLLTKLANLGLIVDSTT